MNDAESNATSLCSKGTHGTILTQNKRSTECTCHSRSSSRRRPNQESYRRPSEVVIKIISASYGPCERNNIFGGEDSDESSPIPSTRDCTSFLVGLLKAAKRREGSNLKDNEQERCQRQQKDTQKGVNTVRLPPTVDGKIQTFVFLLPGVGTSNAEYFRYMFSSASNDGGRKFDSMNAIFGDPCPGKTKRLDVRYTVTEVFMKEIWGVRSPSSSSPPPPPSPLLPYAPTEIHHVSFVEHETVKLRRCLTTKNTANVISNVGDENGGESEHTRGDEGDSYCNYCSRCLENKALWQLRSATSEIVLPIVLPFLDLWERMQCRSICRCWRIIVEECGVSRMIDVNNTDLMTSGRPATASSVAKHSNSFSRSMLRGLLAYSYSSLQSLFLSGFGELQKRDLHPALPTLRNLNVLDISYCFRLDDSTLQILAQAGMTSTTTLRVLYLKGLRKVTDVGLKAICSSCNQLKVLDLSHLTNITDDGGRCIQRLLFLRALFLRDNWLLTNDSIDAITTSCSKLEQLTLWGCIRVRHLNFDIQNNGTSNANTSSSAGNRLVILNLWGCHDLEDDTADVLSSIPNLNCLIVSECHRLTDRFVQIFVEGTEQQNRGERSIQHLHLRYLKRITDAAVVAIALKLRNLFSLDLTFCSKVSAMGIYRLLDELRHSLVELRLRSCRSLKIGSLNLEGDGRGRMASGRPNNNTNSNNEYAGRWVLNALRRRPHSTVDHSLRLIDVRGCGGQPVPNLPYTVEDAFVKGMHALQFEQKTPGFFSRSA